MFGSFFTEGKINKDFQILYNGRNEKHERRRTIYFSTDGRRR